MGVKLFDRDTAGYSLTEVGLKVANEARVLVKEWDRMFADLLSEWEYFQKRAVIVCPEHSSDSPKFSALLKFLRKHLPRDQMPLIVDEQGEHSRDEPPFGQTVLRYWIGSPIIRAVSSVDLGALKASALLPAAHPLARNKRVLVKDLRKLNRISLDPRIHPHIAVCDSNAIGETEYKVRSAESLEEGIQRVAAGEGYLLWHEFSSARLTKVGRLVQIPIQPAAKSPAGLLCRNPLPPVVERIFEVARQFISSGK